MHEITWLRPAILICAQVIQLQKADAKRKMRVAKVLKTSLNLYDSMFTDIGLPAVDKAAVISRSNAEGFSFLAGTLPKLQKALLRGLATGNFDCPTSFRTKRGSKIPVFLGSLFAQVFNKDGTLKGSDCSPIAVQQLCQVCGLVYKASVPRDPAKDAAVIEGFVDVENELCSLSIPDDALLRTANVIVRDLFRDYDRTKLAFKHGPGVTADTRLTEKYEARIPPMPATFSFADAWFINDHDAVDRSYRAPVLGNNDLFVPNDQAKVLLVDKDYRGPRLISCEPACLQYLQQGIKDYVYKAVESHPLTSGSVNFTDQKPSQRGALRASIDRSLSTLDLKDASDRVSLALVMRLFDGTSILNDMILTRSRQTKLPDGRVVVLNKFAPMGSALCFPTMAISIFVLIAAYMVGRGYSLQRIKADVTIFGDDVVVPTELAYEIVRVLERYGLKVNTDKCFIDSHFAEACGGDYFLGNQVTPIRIKRLWHDLRQEEDSANTVVSLVESAHHFDELGYTNLAETLYREVESITGRLPYGYSCSDFLCRLYQPFMGSSAWDKTIEGRKTTAPTVKVATAIPDEKVKTKHVSYYGHRERIEPSLGVSSVPNAGEFNKRSSVRLSFGKADENGFSPYPANRFVPETPLNREVDARSEARRRLAAINGLPT